MAKEDHSTLKRAHELKIKQKCCWITKDRGKSLMKKRRDVEKEGRKKRPYQRQFAWHSNVSNGHHHVTEH